MGSLSCKNRHVAVDFIKGKKKEKKRKVENDCYHWYESIIMVVQFLEATCHSIGRLKKKAKRRNVERLYSMCIQKAQLTSPSFLRGTTKTSMSPFSILWTDKAGILPTTAGLEPGTLSWRS